MAEDGAVDGREPMCLTVQRMQARPGKTYPAHTNKNKGPWFHLMLRSGSIACARPGYALRISEFSKLKETSILCNRCRKVAREIASVQTPVYDVDDIPAYLKTGARGRLLYKRKLKNNEPRKPTHQRALRLSQGEATGHP